MESPDNLYGEYGRREKGFFYDSVWDLTDYPSPRELDEENLRNLLNEIEEEINES